MVLAPLVNACNGGDTRDFLPLDVMASGAYVAFRVDGIKHKRAQTHRPAVTLIRLSAVVQSLNEGERRYSVRERDARSSTCLQLATLDP